MWIGVAEAAYILGISNVRAYVLIREGKLRSKKKNGYLLVREEDVLERARSKPKPGRPRVQKSRT